MEKAGIRDTNLYQYDTYLPFIVQEIKTPEIKDTTALGYCKTSLQRTNMLFTWTLLPSTHLIGTATDP
jgi:hypothetical protein